MTTVGERSGGRRATPARPAALLVLLCAAVPLRPGPVRGQDAPWSATLTAGWLSVSDAGDWSRIEESVARRWPRGDRLSGSVIHTRRFGRWDHGLGLGGTLHPDPRLYLTGSATVTPGAEIREEALLHAEVAFVAGPFVPSLAYEYRSYDQGPVHQVAPALTWYRGRWSVRGEVRVVRNDVGTVNLAGIARARLDVNEAWSAWLGASAGNEDFLVGPPGAQELRTLRTRSAVSGASWSGLPGWTLRLDVTAVDSDPRLSRAGATLSVVRSF